MLSIILVGILTLTFNVPSVKATGTIYIRGDGSIDPHTAPIQQDGDVYTFTGNITSDVDGIVVQRSDIIIDGNGYTLQGSGIEPSYGFDLPDVNSVTIRNTQIKGFSVGVCVYSYAMSGSANNNTIAGNNIENNGDGIVLFSSSDNTVANNSIMENDYYCGIFLDGFSNNTRISGNNIANNGYGVYLTSSSNYNRISENNITNNYYGGLYLFSSSNYNSISGNNITANDYYGILLFSSSNNSISGNNITANNWDGIHLYSSLNNSISGNKITNDYYGIWLGYSSNYNGISGNNITENNFHGIGLGYSSNYNSVSGNNITANSFYGIWLGYSSNNSISGNNITANDWDGIFLDSSSNNSISGNNITNDHDGIYLYSSLNNTISGNNITANNRDGIYLYFSSNNNKIFHNNFVNNNIQAYSSGLPNIWDDGYPSGGNYWSDYTARYPSAVEIDDSRIWNTPYLIDVSNQDNYPLMGPWTANGENVTVTPAADIALTFANVTSEGITTVNKTQSGPVPLEGYKIEGQYCDIQTTATYSGNITIRIVYDDTNMTQQEEESLLLARWNETTQQWEDITQYVDMESNVICGVTDHLSIFGVHSQLIHDLSIFGVHLAKTIIGQGYTLRIDVDVKNEGDFAEDFDVTLDLVAEEVNYLSIFGIHLVEGGVTTLTFNWNTAGYAKTAYSITAHVSQAPYEIDVSDNTFTDGTVKVTISGDVDGDFFVNIKDATQIGLYWMQTVPPAPANVDINGDGIISIKDATLVGLNWLKHA